MTAPLDAGDLRKLCAQLARLPGGVAAALPDFFGALVARAEFRPDGGECWHLAGGGQLFLAAWGEDWRMGFEQAGQTGEIAAFPGFMAEVAHAESVPPMLLALLLVATGQVDDGRRLKRALPRLDGAAKDMMLMSVCRLCG